MTFNLRYASPRGTNAWPARRPVMTECIQKYAPDVMGTQEGLYQQLKELSSDLPDYEWIGLGRDGGSRGEFMAVFYRKARLEPKAFDHFWLSETPEVIGSTHWGNSNRRMVTWVKFLDRTTGRMFLLVNTHLDHEIVAAREKGAALIRQRVASLEEGVPVVLTGDFNSVPSLDKSHELLVAGGFFQDTWDQAAVKRNEGYDTFHAFGGPRQGGRRIDWILTRGPWSCEAVEIVLYSKDRQFPSDHHPYVAWLRFGEAGER
jgi:endonuclease/exonuclease/phosphatase family metal-dependent hydrolase